MIPRTRIVATLLLLSPIAVLGQSSIEDALSREDWQTLSQQFHASVEVYVLNKESSGIEGAKRLVAGFFDAYEVKGFRQRHSGSSKGGSSNYAIGQMTTDQGNFRVSVFYFNSNKGYQITELRIER